MCYRSRVLALCAAILAGTSGIARAELIEPAVPAQHSAKATRQQPVRTPAPKPVASRPVLPDVFGRRAPASAGWGFAPVQPAAQPSCKSGFCGSYLIIGLGS